MPVITHPHRNKPAQNPPGNKPSGMKEGLVKNAGVNPMPTTSKPHLPPFPQNPDDDHGSGFEDDPDWNDHKQCSHPGHNPPGHMVIPPGKRYRHVCPGCKHTSIIKAPFILC